MNIRSSLGLALLFSTHALVACQSEPIDPATLSSATADRTAAIMKAGVASLRDNPEAMAAFTSIVPTSGTTAQPQGIPDLTGTAINSAADQLASLLRERVFVASNIESQTDDEVIYKLAPALLCAPAAGNATDPQCLSLVTKLELRVRMTREGNGARLTLLVGAERLNPVALIVDDNQIAVELALPKVKAALVAYDKALGKDTAQLDRGLTVAGTLRFSLSKDGAHAAKFSTFILELLSIHVAAELGQAFDMTSAVADPAFALAADGTDKTATLSTNLGATEISTTSGTTPIHIVLGGLTGENTIDGAKKEIRLHNAGLGRGTSYVEYDGKKILDVSLNQDTTGVFDAVISRDPTGRLHIAVAPSFRLQVAMKLGLLPASAISSIPAQFLDQTIDMKLDPAGNVGPAVTFVPVGNGTAVRVDQGTLELSSSREPTSKKVSPGQCLTGLATTTEPVGILDSLDTTTCN